MNDPYEQAALQIWEWEGGACGKPDDEPLESDQPLYPKEEKTDGDVQ
jgi:hypothetical protein